jgi:hypothetical protein
MWVQKVLGAEHQVGLAKEKKKNRYNKMTRIFVKIGKAGLKK